ncbi:hypothetical protein EB796_021838 [Bugula neritina]|uniref:Uncharacterized protein n=1 Tax=Bugula neritina TaxID=10212 RepID=A0A7J7J209_BUGNE|nr:hypothetical protein EB796_021838 [Bugula neritina]
MATLYYTPFQKDDPGELPSPDAIENILPDYKYIFYDPNRKKKDKPAETQLRKRWKKIVQLQLQNLVKELKSLLRLQLLIPAM